MAACPNCKDGTYIDRTDRIRTCEVCCGTSFVNPGKFCRCGRSLNFNVAGIGYCGRKDCLQKLSAAA